MIIIDSKSISLHFTSYFISHLISHHFSQLANLNMHVEYLFIKSSRCPRTRPTDVNEFYAFIDVYNVELQLEMLLSFDRFRGTSSLRNDERNSQYSLVI